MESIDYLPMREIIENIWKIDLHLQDKLIVLKLKIHCIWFVSTVDF